MSKKRKLALNYFTEHRDILIHNTPDRQTFDMYAPAEAKRYDRERERESHFERSLVVFRMSLPVHSVVHFSN